MEDQGFIEREAHGDLRDLIGRLHNERATVVVGPNDVLTTAHNRLRNAGFSQLPVIDNNKLVGILTEDTIIRFVFGKPEMMNRSVSDAMETAFIKLWLLVAPAYWYLRVEGNEISRSPADKEGLVMAAITGILMSVIIILMWHFLKVHDSKHSKLRG